MPAHSRPLDVQCSAMGCTKRATVMVYNSSNEKMGERCAFHARELVEFLNEATTRPLPQSLTGQHRDADA